MKLIERIASSAYLGRAAEAVRKNKGAAGVDRMEVDKIEDYVRIHGKELGQAIVSGRYEPMPVRRVYIPKPNGKQRPLGIPTAIDRTVQTSLATALEPYFEKGFSDNSYGFRPRRSAHDAVKQALEYINSGYDWIVDLDIESFFDRVNHDKLISIIRAKVNEKEVLRLIRAFLNAGVLESGAFMPNTVGTPQGGAVSPLLANIYLDLLDKELEARELRFVRYADDVIIFVKSERAAQRVMDSVADWLKRKLFLTVSATKTKVVRPNQSTFLGFRFWSDKGVWKVRPAEDRKARLYAKLKAVLIRRKAAALPLSATFTKVNQILRGWINYFSLGSMKGFLKKLGEWLRHKIRVIILKQWKRPRTIFRNLSILNKKYNCGFSKEEIRQAANSRLGWYRSAGMRTANFLLSPKVLGTGNKKRERPALIDPLKLYCSIKP